MANDTHDKQHVRSLVETRLAFSERVFFAFPPREKLVSFRLALIAKHVDGCWVDFVYVFWENSLFVSCSVACACQLGRN